MAASPYLTAPLKMTTRIGSPLATEAVPIATTATHAANAHLVNRRIIISPTPLEWIARLINRHHRPVPLTGAKAPASPG